MDRSSAVPGLLVCVGLVITGSAAAQASNKAPSAASAQGSTKAPPAKATTATKRLDFVPSSTQGSAAARTAAPVSTRPAQAPVKDHSDCHSSASDA